MKSTHISPAAAAEIERVQNFVAQRDDALALPPVSAEFLHGLVLAGAYRRGLEIGMSYGYSGLWLATALQHNGGHLTTLEKAPHKIERARASFAAANVGDVVTIVEGTAADSLANLDGPFDFVFIDADKENSQRYFDLVWPMLAHRATLVTDNVTSHAAELGGFVEFLRGHERLFSVLVPIGSGLELTVKVDAGASTVSVDVADWVI